MTSKNETAVAAVRGALSIILRNQEPVTSISLRKVWAIVQGSGYAVENFRHALSELVRQGVILLAAEISPAGRKIHQPILLDLDVVPIDYQFDSTSFLDTSGRKVYLPVAYALSESLPARIENLRPRTRVAA